MSAAGTERTRPDDWRRRVIAARGRLLIVLVLGMATLRACSRQRERTLPATGECVAHWVARHVGSREGVEVAVRVGHDDEAPALHLHRRRSAWPVRQGRHGARPGAALLVDCRLHIDAHVGAELVGHGGDAVLGGVAGHEALLKSSSWACHESAPIVEVMNQSAVRTASADDTPGFSGHQ